VREQINTAIGKTIASRIVQMRSLRPGRPQPTYRYSEII
jgi:hypothetical protein